MSEYSDIWEGPDNPPFTSDNRKYIQRDFTARVHEDCCEEVTRIVNIYYQIKDMCPDKSSDRELQEKALKKLQDFLDQFEFPTGSLKELFRLSITIGKLRKDHYYEMYRDHILGGRADDKPAASSLPRRLDAYLKENNISFYCQEIYDSLLDLSKYSSADTYYDVLIHQYEELIQKPTLESLAVILKYFDANVNKSDKYLVQMPIPNSSKQEFLEAHKMITSCTRSCYEHRQKLTQLREIIQRQYSDDAELLKWAKNQEDQETAQDASEYGCVSKTTLILGVVLTLAGFFTGVTFIPGILLIVLWVLLFKTSLGDKISYIREGKEAAKKVAAKKK